MKGLILAAGGASTRFGGDVPKVLVPLHGKPMILHALDAFLSIEGPWDVVVPVPREHRRAFEAVLGSRGRVVAGGATRQESVQAALKALDPNADPVLVHDAARPLVSPETVGRVLSAIEVHGAAAAVLPVVDSIHTVALDGERIESTLDRSRVVRAQTPQGARRELLQDALETARVQQRTATDEIGLLRSSLRVDVFVVAGNARNIKITTRDDLISIERWLSHDARPA